MHNFVIVENANAKAFVCCWMVVGATYDGPLESHHREHVPIPRVAQSAHQRASQTLHRAG